MSGASLAGGPAAPRAAAGSSWDFLSPSSECGIPVAVPCVVLVHWIPFLSWFTPSFFVFVFVFFNLCIYLFLAVLGLRCCAFSSCGELGLLFVAVRGLLLVVASLVVEHGL